MTPSEVIVEEKAVSYTDQLKARINEINGQLLQLDEDFKAGKVTGDEYTEQRTKLKQTGKPTRRAITHGHGNITERATVPTVKSHFPLYSFDL